MTETLFFIVVNDTSLLLITLIPIGVLGYKFFMYGRSSLQGIEFMYQNMITFTDALSSQITHLRRHADIRSPGPRADRQGQAEISRVLEFVGPV
jgi:hypothetical protein